MTVTAAKISMFVSWVEKSCGLSSRFQCFGLTHHPHPQVFKSEDQHGQPEPSQTFSDCLDIYLLSCSVPMTAKFLKLTVPTLNTCFYGIGSSCI